MGFTAGFICPLTIKPYNRGLIRFLFEFIRFGLPVYARTRESGQESGQVFKMADGGGGSSTDDSVLAGLLSASSDLQSLESFDAAFTTRSRDRQSFRSSSHVSDSVSRLDFPLHYYL